MLYTTVVSFQLFPAIIRHSCCFPAIYVICVDQASQLLAVSHALCCSRFPLDVAASSFLPSLFLIYVYYASLTASNFCPPLCGASIRRCSYELFSRLDSLRPCRLAVFIAGFPACHIFLILLTFILSYFFQSPQFP